MKTLATIATTICLIMFNPAVARSTRGTIAYDGQWHLAFATQSGPCDPSYDFDVNISNGIITHPNLVKFRGRVAPNGAARASVEVQDKLASGSGRLSPTNGRGSWSGHSGSARCSGTWTARKN